MNNTNATITVRQDRSDMMFAIIDADGTRVRGTRRRTAIDCVDTATHMIRNGRFDATTVTVTDVFGRVEVFRPWIDRP